jgi:hypothetical protein
MRLRFEASRHDQSDSASMDDVSRPHPRSVFVEKKHHLVGADPDATGRPRSGCCFDATQSSGRSNGSFGARTPTLTHTTRAGLRCSAKAHHDPHPRMPQDHSCRDVSAGTLDEPKTHHNSWRRRISMASSPTGTRFHGTWCLCGL